jgi:RNA polymerase sigma-70 factor (ECF subfamily)
VADQDRNAEPDLQLVRKARDGDSRAFDELVSRYADKAFRLTFKVLRHEQDAEDAVQDAFLAAYRNLTRFEERSSFSTWIYRVAMNAALMRLRKRREGMVSMDRPPRADDREATMQIEDRSAGPLARTASQEVGDAIQEAVAGLPDDLREVFMLREDAGLSNQEVAEMLDLSVPAVKSRLHRARLDLRRRLMPFVDRGRRRSGRE